MVGRAGFEPATYGLKVRWSLEGFRALATLIFTGFRIVPSNFVRDLADNFTG